MFHPPNSRRFFTVAIVCALLTLSVGAVYLFQNPADTTQTDIQSPIAAPPLQDNDSTSTPSAVSSRETTKTGIANPVSMDAAPSESIPLLVHIEDGAAPIRVTLEFTAGGQTRTTAIDNAENNSRHLIPLILPPSESTVLIAKADGYRDYEVNPLNRSAENIVNLQKQLELTVVPLHQNSLPLLEAEISISGQEQGFFFQSLKAESGATVDVKIPHAGTYEISGSHPLYDDIKKPVDIHRNPNLIYLSFDNRSNTVSGEVRDETGAIVTEARLGLYNFDNNQILYSLTSNEEGKFFQDNVPFGMYYLQVDDGRFVENIKVLDKRYRNNEGRYEFQLTREQNSAVIPITVRRIGLLSGLVVNEKGEPVPGAELYAYSYPETNPNVEYPLSDSVFSDDNGHFVLPLKNIFDDNQRVKFYVYAKNYKIKTHTIEKNENSHPEVILVLELNQRRLSGVFVDEQDAPISDYPLFITNHIKLAGLRQRFQVKTDRSGHFDIRLEPGRYFVDSDEYSITEPPIMDIRDRDADFKLVGVKRELEQYTGEVIDSYFRQPINKVSIQLAGAEQSLGNTLSTPDGKWTLQADPKWRELKGPRILLVHHKDYLPFQLELDANQKHYTIELKTDKKVLDVYIEGPVAEIGKVFVTDIRTMTCSKDLVMEGNRVVINNPDTAHGFVIVLSGQWFGVSDVFHFPNQDTIYQKASVRLVGKMNESQTVAVLDEQGNPIRFPTVQIDGVHLDVENGILPYQQTLIANEQGILPDIKNLLFGRLIVKKSGYQVQEAFFQSSHEGPIRIHLKQE